MKDDKQIIEPPLCKCGCGQRVKWSKCRYIYNEFVNGHNSKTVDKKAEHLFQKVRK